MCVFGGGGGFRVVNDPRDDGVNVDTNICVYVCLLHMHMYLYMNISLTIDLSIDLSGRVWFRCNDRSHIVPGLVS